MARRSLTSAVLCHPQDGLQTRGRVVVIGATNRIDSIDPALRRPGRFDREFLFPMPTEKARRRILEIHTDKWKPPPAVRNQHSLFPNICSV